MSPIAKAREIIRLKREVMIAACSQPDGSNGNSDTSLPWWATMMVAMVLITIDLWAPGVWLWLAELLIG